MKWVVKIAPDEPRYFEEARKFLY